MQSPYPTSFRRRMSIRSYTAMKRAASIAPELFTSVAFFAALFVMLPVVAACFHT